MSIVTNFMTAVKYYRQIGQQHIDLCFGKRSGRMEDLYGCQTAVIKIHVETEVIRETFLN
jgi:hypothetical protein